MADTLVVVTYCFILHFYVFFEDILWHGLKVSVALLFFFILTPCVFCNPTSDAKSFNKFTWLFTAVVRWMQFSCSTREVSSSTALKDVLWSLISATTGSSLLRWISQVPVVLTSNYLNWWCVDISNHINIEVDIEIFKPEHKNPLRRNKTNMTSNIPTLAFISGLHTYVHLHGLLIVLI